MGQLKYLIIHCSATREGQYFDGDDIRRWHTSPKSKGGRGWSQVGYSELFLLDGTIQELVKYDDNDIIDPWELTNGALGMNNVSRHICYIGGCNKAGKPKDTRTAEQLKSLEMYVKAHTTLHPNWKIAGHYHFANKACPSFNVENWLESIGFQEKNIYRKP